MDKIDRKTKTKTKTFLIGKELKTNDLLQTAVDLASGRGNQNPRIAYAERRVKPLARLLRCATALRVTAPPCCGSSIWYGRKGTFSARPHGPNAPVWRVVRCYRTLSNEIQTHWLIRTPPFPS